MAGRRGEAFTGKPFKMIGICGRLRGAPGIHSERVITQNTTDLQASLTVQSTTLNEGGLLQLPGHLDEWDLAHAWGRWKETSHRLITHGITEW